MCTTFTMADMADLTCTPKASICTEDLIGGVVSEETADTRLPIYPRLHQNPITGRQSRVHIIKWKDRIWEEATDSDWRLSNLPEPHKEEHRLPHAARILPNAKRSPAGITDQVPPGLQSKRVLLHATPEEIPQAEEEDIRTETIEDKQISYKNLNYESSNQFKCKGHAEIIFNMSFLNSTIFSV